MDLRQSRPSYDYKSSFWPLTGMMAMMIIVASISEGFIAARRDYYDDSWRYYAAAPQGWRSPFRRLCVIF